MKKRKKPPALRIAGEGKERIMALVNALIDEMQKQNMLGNRSPDCDAIFIFNHHKFNDIQISSGKCEIVGARKSALPMRNRDEGAGSMVRG